MPALASQRAAPCSLQECRVCPPPCSSSTGGASALPKASPRSTSPSWPRSSIGRGSSRIARASLLGSGGAPGYRLRAARALGALKEEDAWSTRTSATPSSRPNAILTIDRPERLNAFRGRTVEELIHAFHRAWTDPEVRCAILTGAGERAFCVGGDQKEYVEKGSYGTSENGLFEIERLQQVIRDLPKPVIAAVNGLAIGGGHVLQVVCDVTIAAEHARFGQAGPRVGLLRCGLRHRLPRARGRREARPRDLVLLPPVRRRHRRALGPGEQDRAGGAAARRGARLGARGRGALAHRAALPQDLVQRRHRARARESASSPSRASPASRAPPRPRRAAAPSPRSGPPTSRRRSSASARAQDCVPDGIAAGSSAPAAGPIKPGGPRRR